VLFVQAHLIEVLFSNLLENALGLFRPEDLLSIHGGHLLQNLDVSDLVVNAQLAFLVLVIQSVTLWALLVRLSQSEHRVETRLFVFNHGHCIELLLQFCITGSIG